MIFAKYYPSVSELQLHKAHKYTYFHNDQEFQLLYI